MYAKRICAGIAKAADVFHAKPSRNGTVVRQACIAAADYASVCRVTTRRRVNVLGARVDIAGVAVIVFLREGQRKYSPS